MKFSARCSWEAKWDCKYHVVFIPKYRRQALYKELRRHLGEVFRSLAQQKECRVEEGHVLPDHGHLLRSIPPKGINEMDPSLCGMAVIRQNGERGLITMQP